MPIHELSFYDQDLEASPPAPWVQSREAICASDAVLFITPEYNRSVPGLLKNAIDVGSRPYSKACWSGKPSAVISQSPGALGGFGAQRHLRQSLAWLNAPVLPAPETYLSDADKIVDDSGVLVKDDRLQDLPGRRAEEVRGVDLQDPHRRLTVHESAPGPRERA